MKINTLIKVSIIIPCYNDYLYVEQAVASALAQTYNNIEIILIDDGSNGVTKEILNKLQPKLTLLITQNNLGQSAARNVGINAATGEYLFVLDSDDFVDSTFIEKALNEFNKNSEVNIVSCFANLIYKNKPSEVFKPEGGSIKNFLFKNAVLGTSMFRKNDWIEVGGYDEEMKKGWEDWEFFIRLLKSGGKAVVIDEPLYNYRIKNQSTTKTANKIRYKLYSYIIHKHTDLYKEYFEETVSFLLDLAENNKKNELKRINSFDYRLGHSILKPLRYIKKIVS